MDALMMDMPLLVGSILDHAARFHQDRGVSSRCARKIPTRLSYAEINDRAARATNALRKLGVGDGTRVATLAFNNHWHLELYYGIPAAGGVVHTLNPRLSDEHLEYIVGHAGSEILCFDPMFAPRLAQVKNALPGVRHYIALCGPEDLPPVDLPGLISYEDMIAGETVSRDGWPQLRETDACGMCYTSGTTGHPKGVLYGHRAMVLHAMSASQADAMGLTCADNTLPVVPFFHANGWGTAHIAPMVGTKLVLPGPHLDGDSLFDLMEDEDVTCAMGVPTVWLGLLAAIKKRGKAPKALVRTLVGGAALSRDLQTQYEAFGVSLNAAWGMTENSPLGAINSAKPGVADLPDAERARHRVKAGRPPYGIDMRLVGEDGTILPHDGEESGALQIRGPWVARAYYPGEQTAAFTDDGWFDTGDVATIDSMGFMAITDRSKDLIKSGGEWISSVDLENAATAHPDIAMAAAIGIPHEKWQERPILVCVAAGEKRPDLAEINAFLEQHLAKWWLPDQIHYVDALPIGSTGKILKTELRKQFVQSS